MSKAKIIGRKQEQKLLDEIFNSKKAEFVALYGRRRVGKTYLMEQFFMNKPCLFLHVTGLLQGKLNEQLENFSQVMSETFFAETGLKLERPISWMHAFELLTNTIQKFSKHNRIVFFFDELPWLASKKSGFKAALDYYWNTKWSKNKKILLIVCGSAASWMIKNIINDKGGLHNRITWQIPLYPFSLKETSEYLAYRGQKFNERQVLELYMALGGIPHYLEKVRPSLSATQNISRLCFSRDGQLVNEFNKLFSSLFDKAKAYVEIIKIIASKRQGIERNTIEAKAKLTAMGGTLTERLTALEEAGFIKGFIPFGHTERGTYYKIIDEYCLFYLTWIQPVYRQIQNETITDYWESKVTTGSWKSWSGYAFESICFKHISQIKHALFIPLGSLSGSWRFQSNIKGQDGTQIDLLFDRDDGIITICEIKYYKDDFEIDKKYADILKKKIEVFKQQTKTKKQIFLSIITAGGLKRNCYSEEMITGRVVLEDLFE